MLGSNFSLINLCTLYKKCVKRLLNRICSMIPGFISALPKELLQYSNNSSANSVEEVGNFNSSTIILQVSCSFVPTTLILTSSVYFFPYFSNALSIHSLQISSVSETKRTIDWRHQIENSLSPPRHSFKAFWTN